MLEISPRRSRRASYTPYCDTFGESEKHHALQNKSPLLLPPEDSFKRKRRSLGDVFEDLTSGLKDSSSQPNKLDWLISKKLGLTLILFIFGGNSYYCASPSHFSFLKALKAEYDDGNPLKSLIPSVFKSII